MKKIALIISLVAFVSLQGFSQKGTYSYGLKFGPAFDWASSASTATSNHGVRLGFNLGGIVDKYFTDHIALSSGLNFYYWRGHYSFTDLRVAPDFLEEAPISIDRYVRANYFEVPIMIKVNYEIVDGWKAFAEAGVGIGLNTKDATKDTYEFYWISSSEKSYTNSSFYQYRWLQAALNFAAGAEFQVNKKFSIFAQLSYNHGLTNSFTRNMKKLTASDIKTNFIGLEIGIMH